MKTRTLLIAIIAFVAASCSSGKKQFERGNYREALHQAINRLQSSPNNKKATETLARAYPLALKYYLRQIDNKLESHDPHQWEWVVVHYQDLNRVYEAIQRSPAALRWVPNPQPFYRELKEAQTKAAEVRYQWGVEALNRHNKADARLAFEHFEVAQKMIPGYRDVPQKMDEAWEQGTVKVLVDMVPVSSRYYRVDADFFQQAINRYLNDFESTRFVDFITEKDPLASRHWDQILKVQFEDFVVGHTHSRHRQKRLSRDSVSVGSVTLEDGTVKEVYQTVYATLNLFSKEVISEGLVSMQVTDAVHGGVLHHQEFPGSFTWVSEWGHFNGDERALSKKQVRLCQRHEELPPPPQVLFHEITKPIHNQLTRQISHLYGVY